LRSGRALHQHGLRKYILFPPSVGAGCCRQHGQQSMSALAAANRRLSCGSSS
jgi:hypothetical protein